MTRSARILPPHIPKPNSPSQGIWRVWVLQFLLLLTVVGMAFGCALTMATVLDFAVKGVHSLR